MLEYDIDEAQALLEKNLSTASRNLETLEDDLDFLRDQFTTTEVSILPPCSPLLIQPVLQSCFCDTNSLFSLVMGETKLSESVNHSEAVALNSLEHLIQSKIVTSSGKTLGIVFVCMDKIMTMIRSQNTNGLTDLIIIFV